MCLRRVELHQYLCCLVKHGVYGVFYFSTDTSVLGLNYKLIYFIQTYLNIETRPYEMKELHIWSHEQSVGWKDIDYADTEGKIGRWLKRMEMGETEKKVRKERKPKLF
jgi:hypothetical protein